MSDAGDLDHLLRYVRESRGFDFTGYKPSTLQRRVRKRMDAVAVESFEAYGEFLEVHPDEFDELFDTILINVTSFFRDAEAWEVIRSRVVPAIIDGKAADAPIRIWSAGCATGQEAYSAAMLLAEALGEEAFQRRVKIYGTDADEQALETARLALYDPAKLEDVPEDLLMRYFERMGMRWCFRKDLRRSMIFGRNNLVRDAPISRIDLLLCRNTLMYFNSEAQGQILRRLHFALQPAGFLFLGKSEMLVTRRDLFEAVDLKRRIFRRASAVSHLEMPLAFAVEPGSGHAHGAAAIAERALNADEAPHIVIGRDRTLLLANEAARSALRLGDPDVGRPLQDLAVSYRPVELRSSLDAVFAEGRAPTLGPVSQPRGGEDRLFEVHLLPLLSSDEVDAVSVVFADVTERHRAQQDAERSRQELGTAYEELQSTVEELETTNEELQSTNEELETTNEELQSTNEELETINDELRERSTELRESNAIMEVILRAKGVGVIVVDPEQRVRLWSRESEDLWGVRAEEVVDLPLGDLDVGLPVEQVRPLVRQVLLNGKEPPVSESFLARDRRGRAFRCAVTVMRLDVDDTAVTGVVVLTERLREQELGAAS